MEQYLGLEKLYVLGTNCVDNGRRQGLDKFLRAASSRPRDVLHYEFMQVGGRPGFLTSTSPIQDFRGCVGLP